MLLKFNQRLRSEMNAEMLLLHSLGLGWLDAVAFLSFSQCSLDTSDAYPAALREMPFSESASLFVVPATCN